MTLVDTGLVNFFIGCYILIILLLCIVVLRSQINLKDKVIWLVLLLFLPVLGVFFYIISITFKVAS
ncbi:PLDc N-terminal domain-containing protein [Winogradskyella alexanderae]|uniref:PLDc N-terminal domain-containing protein n=1 Tax=Winogradskyella alexanderae TaxID=2877123 RepID=A0ABS7XSL1_9FLAO|nr:PLDc N-terminal domain-containing protein [Winogradskyella alexanderae]